MLTNLLIRNYAIIDHLELEWPQGMSAITGETGAGKSIIIGAIQFVLGARADSKVLCQPDEKCIVELRFTQLEHQREELSQLEFLDDSEEILIRREILPNGRSRSFVNDSPVTVSDLQTLSPLLIAIHQQFDQLDILDNAVQLEMLDQYLGLQSEVESCGEEYRLWRNLLGEQKHLEEEQRRANEEKDYVEFQYRELHDAALLDNEYTGIEEELALALKAGEILNSARTASELIEGEQGVMDQLNTIGQSMKGILQLPGIGELHQQLQDARSGLKEFNTAFNRLADRTDFDEEKISLLQQRFDLLTRLMKKHRVKSDTALIELRDQLYERLRGFSNVYEEIEKLKKKIDLAYQQLLQRARSISQLRQKKAPGMEPEVTALLQQLGMEFAQFNVGLSQITEPGPTGMDRADFLFSANKGKAPAPIRLQASGGEISRLNLVLKSVISKRSKLPTMIFDEIDTGVSGQVALKMGDILREISAHQQLITITHSPQVASRATHHFLVYKETNSKISNTRLKKLSRDERMTELAKMLSGDPPTPSALKNARELISSAN